MFKKYRKKPVVISAMQWKGDFFEVISFPAIDGLCIELEDDKLKIHTLEGNMTANIGDWIIIGSPPCQGFSTLGKRNVLDPRNSLVFEYARFISEMKPKALAMENVPNIVNMVTPDGIPIMDEFCRILEDGGFGVTDALKKSLALTAGVGGALRSASNCSFKKNKQKTVKRRIKNKEEQLNLF